MYYIGLAWLEPFLCKTLPQSTGQLNLNLTLTCESLKKFCKILASSTRAMYQRITVHAVQQVSNNTHVVYLLCPTTTESCSCTVRKV